jgi:YD repeat-containing protein
MRQAIGGLGQTTKYSHDPAGNLTQIMDPLGHVTNEAYDALNRLVQTIDPNGGTASFAYDPKSRLAGVMDSRGLVTRYTHDGLDDVTSITSPDTGVTAKTYDAAGNVITSTDARGNTTAYSYDALNRVAKATLANGNAITYQYDQGPSGIGRLTSLTDPTGTTAWAYNRHGQVNLKQQRSGAVTLTERRTYTPATGQLASIAYPSGSMVLFSYDANGQVSAITDQPPGGGAANILLSHITYQPFGPAAAWLEGNGASYGRGFDLDGRITGLTLPAGDTIALSYDAASHISGMTETGLPAKGFGYDALGRLTAYTSGGATQTYTYDANGNRASYAATTPPVSLAYNVDPASNRLLGIGGGWTGSFTYDAAGNMLSYATPFSGYTFAYNVRNRLAESFVGAIGTTHLINGLGQRVSKVIAGFRS